MTLPDTAEAVVFEDGEAIGWYGVSDEGFVYELSTTHGPAADALRGAEDAEGIATSVGRGGEIRESYIEADANEKQKRAEERLLYSAGTDAVAVENATQQQLEDAAGPAPRLTDQKSTVKYIKDPSDAPGGVEVHEDTQGRFYYVTSEAGGWEGDAQNAFEVDVRDADDVDDEDPPKGTVRDEGNYTGPRDDQGLAAPEVARMMMEKGVSDKLWVPYQGPRGGAGWRNLETGRIEYQTTPPGPTVESEQELREALDAPGGAVSANNVVSDGEIEVRLAEDASVFKLDGEPAPVLTVESGAELTFEVQAEGHPFYISRSPGGGAYTDAVESNVSVSNAEETQGGRHAVDVGELTLRVTNDHDKLYYACANHEGMGGVLEVVDSDLGSRGFRTAQKAGGRVYVDGGVSEVPDGKVARVDDEGCMFYVAGGPPSDPQPGAAEKAVSLLDRLLNAAGF